jgi:ATP-dependent DNA helicase RecG
MVVVTARIQDESGEINAVWFNQGFMEKMLKVGMHVTLHGKVDFNWKSKERFLSSPILVKEEKIVPVYSEAAGIPSKIYEKIISAAMKALYEIEDWLPEEIKEAEDLIDLPEALKQIHHPSSFEALEAAKERLAFDELFLIALSMAEVKKESQKEAGLQIKIDEQLLKDFVAKLPFTLTNGQKKAAWEIIKDLEKPHPMNRLIEGDVGSGKTVVAAMAALVVMKNGFQVAWMAPTEILAKQHYKNVSKLLEPFGIKTALLTGSIKEDHSQAQMIIGTQALIQDKIEYQNLGLVIVDEQHRFGVAQRANLRTKNTLMPHLLSMTATPIPRTLALGLYGDLDISIINELPAGRQEIITKAVQPHDREKAYEFIRSQIKEGRQAYVVCPLIEGKEPKIEQDGQINIFEIEKKSALQEFEKLSKQIFPERSRPIRRTGS